MTNDVTAALSRIESELQAQGAGFITLRRPHELSRERTIEAVRELAGTPHPDLIEWLLWQDGCEPGSRGFTPTVFGDWLVVGVTEYLQGNAVYRELFSVAGDERNLWVPIVYNDTVMLAMNAQTGEVHRLVEWIRLERLHKSIADLLDAWTELLKTTVVWDKAAESWAGRDGAAPAPELLRRAGY
jgi:hypothetical protein